MKREVWPWVAAGLLCVACDKPAAPKAPAPLPAASVIRYLHEPFRAGEGQAASTCRIDDAALSLTESPVLPYPGARVRPDVRAVTLTLRCEDAQHHERPPSEALPRNAVLLLVHGRERWAPRPRLDDDPEELLRFELPDLDADVLTTPRRYDADTGTLSVPHERHVARLRLEAGARTVEVVLRARAQNAALDSFLDRLLPALTTDTSLRGLFANPDGEAALSELRTVYRAVRERFRFARVELGEIAQGSANELLLTLHAQRPRARAHSFEVARFVLEVAVAPDGTLGVRRFANAEAERARLACGGLEEDLAQAIASAPRSESGENCNVLGVLVPQRCADLSPKLLSRALEVGSRCRVSDALETRRDKLPPDFQLTLRRGRAARLDHDPRYVVTLFHQGQVVFHGRHWVRSRERSDGRTDPALLSGLWAHVQALELFARRGGAPKPSCSPTDPHGDVINVRAYDRERMLVNRDGCRGPFSESELIQLRNHVEQVAAVSAWTEPAPASMDGDVEHWAVADDD